MKKAAKLFLYILLAIFLILALCGLYLSERDYTAYFNHTKGILSESKSTRFAKDTSFVRQWISVKGSTGLIVECGLLTPAHVSPDKRYPAIILLGGKTTGKHAIDYALDIRSVIIAAPDYPYNPHESYSTLEIISDIPRIRKAALDMVPSVMLLIDYLMSRPDVDTSRVILLGYSFGAPFIPCIAANDKRAAVAAIVFGGGNLRALIRHNVRRYRGAMMSDFVSLLGAVLLRPLEPLRYVDNISPTPLLMINGTKDEQVPGVYAEELYKRARGPKKLVWLDANHVNPRNVVLTRLIVATLKSELNQMGILTLEN